MIYSSFEDLIIPKIIPNRDSIIKSNKNTGNCHPICLSSQYPAKPARPIVTTICMARLEYLK